MQNIVLRIRCLVLSPHSTMLQLYNLVNVLWQEDVFVKVLYSDYIIFLYVSIFR